jgi:hypothetical protein
MIDEVMSGGSFYSSNSFTLHFGLGTATAVDAIDVRWPAGTTQHFEKIPAGSIRITEGADIIRNSGK